MAEDTGDKTEAPTPQRRQEAREQGQIARSPDLTAAVLLMAFLLMLKGFGTPLVGALRSLLEEFLSPGRLSEPATHVGQTIQHAVLIGCGAVAPLLLGAVCVAVAVNLAQVGFFLSGSRLQPNFATLNPLPGLAKIVQRDNVVHLVMNLIKLGLVLAIAYSAVRSRMGAIIGCEQLSSEQAFGLGAALVYAVGIRVAGFLLVLAVLDYGYQKFKTEQELKMTKQEVKDEMRRMDGDPKIKQRRRQIAMQMAQKKLKRDVPTADVVVTNPTEFAVALKYDSATMHAPRVIAKGQDLMAKRIRELAIEAGVPILERKPLARALYKTVQVGQEIPEQFYAAVAEILAYVYELSGKAKRRVLAGAGVN